MTYQEQCKLLLKTFDAMFPLHSKIVLFAPMHPTALGKWVLLEDSPLGYLYERVG